MKIDIPVDHDDIAQKKADSRGRISLGPQYADKNVLVTVLGSEDPVDYDAAQDAAREATELFDEINDMDQFQELLANDEYEQAVSMMGLEPEDADRIIDAWQETVHG